MSTTWKHEGTFYIPAAIERVFAACCEPAQLRAWFAEHVDVGSAVGQPFRFWGRHTLDTASPDAADQRLLAFEPQRRIAFSWTWSGVPGEVEWSFAPGVMPTFDCGGPAEEKPPQPAIEIKLTHTLHGDLPYPRPRQLVDDSWRLAFGNLSAHVLGDGNVVLPDYADPEPQVRLSVVIDAPPAAVWKALTEPALLNQWLARAAEVELHAGGKFDLGWAPSPQAMCRVLEVEPNRRLRISWPDWRGQAQVPDQHVTFELVPQGDGTRVDFVHGGFVRPADRSDYQQGWTGFLDGLRDLCQGAAR